MGKRDDETQLKGIIRDFQNHWPAEIDDYLPPEGAVRRRAIIALSNIDLELRWGTRREGRAADYFGRHPEAWPANGHATLELIAAEYELRREHLELEPYCKDYADRHDGLIEHMRKRFRRAAPAPRYRGYRHIESGGLGDVFTVQDTQLGRTVAVKRMRDCHRGNSRIQEQFVFEAEVTGCLEHPGILPVYSLDRGEDGRPEYAMPFIGRERDETLRAAISPVKPGDGLARARTLREMLGRFVFICRTIAYAHDRGYLHRDIKPDNILLGQFGETWVIDWGLAKSYKPMPALSPAEESTSDRTSTDPQGLSSSGTIAGGTKYYRSPEQAEGLPVGPSSDVYSLGATLYCIATGHNPGWNPDESAKPIEFEVIPPRQIVSTIPREIEVIVLKAMAHDPEKRYASADALADDVQAYLDGERVRAWREPVMARARRVIVKHPTAAASMLMGMALVAVTLLSIMIIEDINLNNKLILANKDAELSKAISTLNSNQINSINTLAELSRDDVASRKFHKIDPENVDDALKTIQNLRQTQKTTSPEIRENWAITALKVADETRKRGSLEDSKRAYRLARDIYTELVRDFPKNEGAPKNLAACHQNLANLEVETGETEAARKSLLDGASLLEPIANDDRSDHEARFKLAKIRLTMAILEKDTNNVATASREAQAGLKLMEDLVRDEPGNKDYLLHQAKGLSTLGNVLGSGGKITEALKAHEKGLEIRQRLASEDPSNLEYQADLALSFYNIGFLKGQLLDSAVGRTQDRSTLLEGYKEAIDALVECAKIREMLHRSLKGDTRTFSQLCQVQGEIGSLILRHGRKDQGTLAEASKLLESAIHGYEQLKSNHETSTEFSEPFAACCQNLGVIQLLRKDPDAGFASFARAEDEYKKLLANDPSNRRYRQMLGKQAFSVGNLLIALGGSKEKARQYLEKARDIQDALVKETPDNAGYQRQLKMTTDLLQ